MNHNGSRLSPLPASESRKRCPLLDIILPVPVKGGRPLIAAASSCRTRNAKKMQPNPAARIMRYSGSWSEKGPGTKLLACGFT